MCLQSKSNPCYFVLCGCAQKSERNIVCVRARVRVSMGMCCNIPSFSHGSELHPSAPFGEVSSGSPHVKPSHPLAHSHLYPKSSSTTQLPPFIHAPYSQLDPPLSLTGDPAPLSLSTQSNPLKPGAQLHKKPPSSAGMHVPAGDQYTRELNPHYQ